MERIRQRTGIARVQAPIGAPERQLSRGVAVTEADDPSASVIVIGKRLIHTIIVD